ncbi:hypothetical protein D0868_07756 [Hortaea werneckii]|nr:hypothetical protein D0868_07756 [Hortaea werneckii]RMY38137.1 hypothetical protein D0866_02804 [Hortaea werneckii]
MLWFTSFVTLLASVELVLAMPGGNMHTTTSCATQSTCSAVYSTYSKEKDVPVTKVITTTVYKPETKTTTVHKPYPTTVYTTITATTNKVVTQTKTEHVKSKTYTQICYVRTAMNDKMTNGWILNASQTKPKWIWTTTERIWTKTIPVADVQTSSVVQTKTSDVPSTYTTSKPYPETSTKTEYSKTTKVWTKSVGSKCHPTKTDCKTMTSYS